MTYEIGSHFHFEPALENDDSQNKADWLPNIGDSTYTFSGRAAIELAIKDIRFTEEVNTVYMPSYCCYSMIEPFVKNGIKVIYYDVQFNETDGIIYDINLNTECDIFFAMSYFGVEKFQLDSVIQSFVEKGTKVIEDITHRILSEQNNSSKAHYCIASLRKWFAIPTGGYLTKRYGEIFKKPYLESNKLVEEKVTAMYEKHEYLKGNNIKKDSFLDKFSRFDEKVRNITLDYKIDDLSLKLVNNIKIENVRVKRRKNATILYNNIKKYSNLKLLIPETNFNENCPLFVPIMLTDGKRDDLRKVLIENQIYCPVHWPQKDNSNSIWKYELSLICDQRYNEADMEYTLEIIDKWYRENYQ